MLTPVDATTAGRSKSKPARPSPSHQLSPASKSIGTNDSASGTPTPISWRRCRFHACVAPRSTSKMRTASSGRRSASVSRPAPRSTTCETPAATCSLIRSSTKRARATIDAAEPTGEGRIHVGPLAPRRVGRDQLQAERVFEHVRRSVDLDMERSPQRGTHRRAVGDLRVVVGVRRQRRHSKTVCPWWCRMSGPCVIALRVGAPHR